MINIAEDNIAEENDTLFEFKKQIGTIAASKFSTIVYNDNKIATLLSPNFKKLSFVSESRRESELALIKDLINQKITDSLEYKMEEINEQPEESKMQRFGDYEIDFDYIEEHTSELDEYLKEKITKIYENPLEYWETSKYLKLKEIAEEVFSRPASSSCSERVFSYSKKILKKDRYRLDTATLSKLTVYTNNRLNKNN